jgi:hypothetical protein
VQEENNMIVEGKTKCRLHRMRPKVDSIYNLTNGQRWEGDTAVKKAVLICLICEFLPDEDDMFSLSKTSQ